MGGKAVFFGFRSSCSLSYGVFVCVLTDLSFKHAAALERENWEDERAGRC